MHKFESPELSFVYPENWTLFVNDGDEHSGEEETNEVTLQSPNSAQLTIALYDLFEDTEDLLQRTLEALKAEYEDLEVDKVTADLGDFHLVGYDVTFFYLDLLVVAELRIAKRQNDQVLFLIQSESRELEANQEVFAAIMLSLLNPNLMDG